MTRRLAGLALLLAALPLAAQRPASGCVFHIDRVGGVGSQAVVGADTNYYAGGGVQMRCLGTAVRMSSDSVAFYGRVGNSQVVFVGRVKYRDSLITMDADRGIYYRNGERWEARGNVATENLANGSTLTGPSLDYYRAIPGTRDTSEIYAIGRPTIRSIPTDSTGAHGEPYVVVADRVRLKGNDRMWGGGKVTVDRSDFAARSDSLFLDTGAGSNGVLLGSPEMHGLGRDSFNLTGRRIDLTLERQAITYLTSVGQAHALGRALDLVADTIGLDLDQQQLIQTIAWGDSLKPKGLTADYEIRGDSLAFDTPGQRLTEVRSFGKAWVGGAVDSSTGERDWMSGDTVVAHFIQADSAGVPRTTLATLASTGSARSYYRVSDQQRNGGLPSINYARGERITVHMRTSGRRGVERVDLRGQVDGLNLEPLPAGADTTATDSLPPRRRT